MSDATNYRAKAEECRRAAAHAKFPIEKESWLELAEQWMSLARDADRKPGEG